MYMYIEGTNKFALYQHFAIIDRQIIFEIQIEIML